MKKSILPVLAIFVPIVGFAHSGASFQYRSPLGKVEQCVVLPQIPGGDYSGKDEAKEKELCAIDFYDGKTAMCPKTWSTSAATIIQDLVGSLTVSQHESSRCGDRTIKTKAKFKQTMNQPKTSGTFSTASLLYYH